MNQLPENSLGTYDVTSVISYLIGLGQGISIEYTVHTLSHVPPLISFINQLHLADKKTNTSTSRRSLIIVRRPLPRFCTVVKELTRFRHVNNMATSLTGARFWNHSNF